MPDRFLYGRTQPRPRRCAQRPWTNALTSAGVAPAKIDRTTTDSMLSRDSPRVNGVVAAARAMIPRAAHPNVRAVILRAEDPEPIVRALAHSSRTGSPEPDESYAKGNKCTGMSATRRYRYSSKAVTLGAHRAVATTICLAHPRRSRVASEQHPVKPHGDALCPPQLARLNALRIHRVPPLIVA